MSATASRSPEDPRSPEGPIIDYDRGGYDYRSFWTGKEYERWAEARVVRRLVADLGSPRWFANFGGGFGRLAPRYTPLVHESVLMDYSVTNLSRAAEIHHESILAGRFHLIRCDLNHLPFVDAAFDAGMVIRVLHHLPQVDRTLAEMGRVLGGTWIIDVPIKHHLRERVHAAAQRDLPRLSSPEPRITGDSEFPFYNFQLDRVREDLVLQGWQTELVASVNNFRRWDRRLPGPAVRALRPLVYGLEVVAQAAGRGWWGPSQFVRARRRPPIVPKLHEESSAIAGGDQRLARRMQCPTCRGALRWSPERAQCRNCSTSFAKRGPFWDFVAA